MISVSSLLRIWAPLTVYFKLYPWNPLEVRALVADVTQDMADSPRSPHLPRESSRKPSTDAPSTASQGPPLVGGYRVGDVTWSRVTIGKGKKIKVKEGARGVIEGRPPPGEDGRRPDQTLRVLFDGAEQAYIYIYIYM